MQGKEEPASEAVVKQADAECKFLCLEVLRDDLLRLWLKEFRAWKGVDRMNPFRSLLIPR